jgi:mono/diheme cytochrome c family protein
MGEHATLKEHVEVTLKNLKGKGLPEEDLSNLLAYVSQMKKPKRQPANDAERGKQVFASAECAHCHTAGSTDRQVHDVGTGGSFMTPTLASAGTRRALMHDGRFKNLDELLSGTPNMGRGSELAADDRKALAAYLETL